MFKCFQNMLNQRFFRHSSSCFMRLISPATPEQKWRFCHLFVIQMTQKIQLFPNISSICLPYSFGGLKWQKRGFCSIFVISRTKIRIKKFSFLAMTTIGIQNPKLIVTNDYQPFLANFEWFLAHFQISDVKPKLSQFKQKVRKNGIFWNKNLFKKFFLRLFLSPNPSYAKKFGQKGL